MFRRRFQRFAINRQEDNFGVNMRDDIGNWIRTDFAGGFVVGIDFLRNTAFVSAGYKLPTILVLIFNRFGS